MLQLEIYDIQLHLNLLLLSDYASTTDVVTGLDTIYHFGDALCGYIHC